MMRSVQRILAIFESFTAEQTSLSLQEIADRVDLPKSTSFRIVLSLEKAGYLVRLENQRYCLSFQFTRLAGLVKSTLGIREIARPVMMELAEKTRESVSVHTVSERNRMCIDSVSGGLALRSVVQPGEQVPLLSGSASKVLMAYMPSTQQASLVTAFARAAKLTQAQALAQLEEIRKNGYAISHGERLLGHSAISAPIMDVENEVHYCLSIGGPTVRIQMHEKEYIALVIQSAGEISLQFGAPAPR